MKVGDQVKYVGTHTGYARQANGSIGTVLETPMMPHYASWTKVRWNNNNSVVYGYPTCDLLWVDEPLMQPEFELDEINMAQEIYSKLEGR